MNAKACKALRFINNHKMVGMPKWKTRVAYRRLKDAARKKPALIVAAKRDRMTFLGVQEFVRRDEARMRALGTNMAGTMEDMLAKSMEWTGPNPEPEGYEHKRYPA